MFGAGSDIILGVIEARDQSRYAKALQRLSVAGTQSTTGTSGLPDRQRFRNVLEIASGTTERNATSSIKRSKAEEAFRQLEQLTLQKALETLIPDSITGTKKSAPGVLVWKAKLAEVLARSISDGNQIGIASRLHAGFVQLKRSAET